MEPLLPVSPLPQEAAPWPDEDAEAEAGEDGETCFTPQA